MARRHGKQGEVLMDPTGADPGTPVLIASIRNFTLDASSENVPVTAFGDTNVQYVKGLPSYQGELGGWFEATETALFDAAFAGTPVTLKLVPSTLDPTFFFSGLAYIDTGIECPADGAVSTTGSWVAAGNWTMTTT
jgi:hypothetical protein